MQPKSTRANPGERSWLDYIKSLSDSELRELHIANRYDQPIHDERMRRETRANWIRGARNLALIVLALATFAFIYDHASTAQWSALLIVWIPIALLFVAGRGATSK